jgi:hypothetical protein
VRDPTVLLADEPVASLDPMTGREFLDVSGAGEQRLRPNDLLERFEELRCSDQLEENAARLLREFYVRPIGLIPARRS